MRLHFITSAPIKYQIEPYDLYDSFDLVSQGRLLAPLIPDAQERIQNMEFPFDVSAIRTILAAEQGQTLETARLLAQSMRTHADIVSTPLLNGIRFKMRELLPKSEFDAKNPDAGLATARREFVQRFVNNELSETTETYRQRIKALTSLARTCTPEVLIIGHSFSLKLMELELTEPGIFGNAKHLIKRFGPEHAPYESLSGFSIDIT